MKQNQRKHSAMMAQIPRERRDNKRASAWLAKQSLKAKPKPKPKQHPLERWQIRLRVQKKGAARAGEAAVEGHRVSTNRLLARRIDNAYNNH
jgi:hypothetical protein